MSATAEVEPVVKPRNRPAHRGDTIDLGGKLVLGAGALTAFYLLAAPLGMLFATSLRGPSDYLPFEAGARWTLDNYKAVFAEPALYTQIIPDTLVFAFGSVSVTFAVAFVLAWLVERTDLPGRNIWYSVILFPLLVPTTVLAIAWIYLFGPQAGWVNVWIRDLFGLTGAGPVNIFSMGGLIACQSLASTPFVFLLLCAAIRSMNPSFEEASAASGASPIATFWRVTLPVLLPGLLAPLILILLVNLEQIEIPLIIGMPARINVFAYRIWYELNPPSGLPNYGGAAAVAVPFLILGMFMLMIYNRVIRRAGSFVTVTGKAYRQKRLRLGRWKMPALAFAGTYVAVAAVLPTLILIWTSFFGFAPLSLKSLDSFSTTAYASLFAGKTFWLAVRNTLLVAIGSAVLVTLVGSLLAWIVVRTKFWYRRAVDFLSFTSIAIPSVIAGLSVMLVYLSVPVGIYGTIWILIIAYSYRFAVTTRLSRAALMQIHRELEEASAASGARWLTTQMRVVIPLLRPSLVSSFILLMIIGVREFTIPIVLFSQENVMLSVLLYRLFVDGHAAAASALAVLIIALVVPIIAFARGYVAPRQLTE